MFVYKTHSFGDEVVDSWKSNAAFARSVVARSEARKKQKILLRLEERFSASGQEDVDAFLQERLKTVRKKWAIYMLKLIISWVVVGVTLPYEDDSFDSLLAMVTSGSITDALYGIAMLLLSAITLIGIVYFIYCSVRSSGFNRERKVIKELLDQRRLDSFLG